MENESPSPPRTEVDNDAEMAMAEKRDIEANRSIKISERIMHVTWPWYLTTMSSGGMATVIGQQPHTFTGLKTIGKIFFIWDLFLFVIIVGLTVQRFARQPDLLWRSLRNPSESLFMPSLLISIANIIISTEEYAASSVGPWLSVALRVVFWIYVAVSFLMAVFLYLDLFSARRASEKDILPAWLLPFIPIMLSGIVAGSIASMQPEVYRMSILVAGVTFQGLGFWGSISLYGAFCYRLIKIGIPAPKLRAGMFIAVAPPAFTALSLIKMSQAIPSNATYFIHHPTAIENLQQVALAFGIFIWALAFWWFSISLTTLLMAFGQLNFNLTWYVMIFPNVGFTISLISIGKGLESNAILWVSSIMTILLVATYLWILVMHARAIYRCDVLWPGKDEDKDT